MCVLDKRGMNQGGKSRISGLGRRCVCDGGESRIWMKEGFVRKGN